MRSKPWQCREGLKWNFEKSEDETMIASRGSQKWILKEVRWVHECMNVCNIFHFFYSYFYFFFCKRCMLTMRVLEHIHRILWRHENVCMEYILSIFVYWMNDAYMKFFIFIEWMIIWKCIYEFLYENACPKMVPLVKWQISVIFKMLFFPNIITI